MDGLEEFGAEQVAILMVNALLVLVVEFNVTVYQVKRQQLSQKFNSTATLVMIFMMSAMSMDLTSPFHSDLSLASSKRLKPNLIVELLIVREILMQIAPEMLLWRMEAKLLLVAIKMLNFSSKIVQMPTALIMMIRRVHSHALRILKVTTKSSFVLD